MSSHDELLILLSATPGFGELETGVGAGDGGESDTRDGGESDIELLAFL